MQSFLECVSSVVHKIDGQNACIIAGAIFGFFIELIIIVLWEPTVIYIPSLSHKALLKIPFLYPA